MRPLALISTSKYLLSVLIAAAVIALVGTTVGYSALSRQMTLSLDGETSSIRTMSGTVGDVLADEGIKVTSHDIVAPGLDEQVADGARITVRFGRPLELTVDGQQQTHWVHSTDVAGALAEIGRRYVGADLSASRGAAIDRTGMSLTVFTPKNLTLQVGKDDAVAQEVAGATVADVLSTLGVDADEDDIVKPSRDALVTEGMTIKVIKVRIAEKSVAGEAVPFQTIERKNANLDAGTRRVLKKGVEGLRDVTYRLEFRNGELKARKVVSETVLKAPVDEVVEVGTKSSPYGAFDRIAQCESGGNWHINTGNGYYGGLQFSASTWRAWGGTGLPHQHSREEQIAVAKRMVAASGGYGAWPHCGRLA